MVQAGGGPPANNTPVQVGREVMVVPGRGGADEQKANNKILVGTTSLATTEFHGAVRGPHPPRSHDIGDMGV